MEWELDTAPVPRQPAPDLDSDQKLVVVHRGRPLLVLAGPGTGKTTTLVETVVARLTDPAQPVAPESIAVLTFGRKAAAEIRDRIAARIGGGLLPTVATFHSFAYGFVQQGNDGSETSPLPRLLTGAEEDVRIRDLIMGSAADHTVAWPADVHGALGTLGFANEVRAVLARARQYGIDPAALRAIGRASDRPAWQAIGQLAVQDDAVMAFQDVMDYTDLLVRAVERAQQLAAAGSHPFDLIVVDEYQDTDPLQVALLKALVGPSTTFIAVGDPDQGIYGFRGASIAAVTRFADDFPDAAPPIVLRHVRRFGPRIKAAANVVLAAQAYPGLSAEVLTDHRNPTCVNDGVDEIAIQTFSSMPSLAAGIAEDIAQAHLADGIPWESMAILTRNGQEMKTLERALTMAHIPVASARDDIPLRQEPAVAVLLHAMRLCLHPDRMRPAQANDLLMGPLCGLDALQMRRWGRAQRAAWREADPHTAPPPAQVLMRDALIGTQPLRAPQEIRQSVERLQDLIAAAHDQIRSHVSPAEVLWQLWSGEVRGVRSHHWPERLRSAALHGSRTANHDLDAIMALFDAASRFVGRNRGAAGIRDFLDSLAAQELPTEAVIERAPRADAVRLLTAHRAKGLEWDAVWIVGLQDGMWPNVRPRGSVLEPDRLTSTGLGSPPSARALLDEERRLLYVACTRARHRVTICAVNAADTDGERPSRFIDELVAAGIPAHAPAHDTTLTSLPTLVATLRNHLDDPTLGSAAAALLAELAMARDDDHQPLVPWADPSTWWGVNAWSPGAHAVLDPSTPLPLSGSILETLRTCPRRWFLERQAHADPPKSNAAVTGSVVHTVAEFIGKDAVAADAHDIDALVDQVWSALPFDAPWQSRQERAGARAALERFCVYHRAAERELIDTEVELVSEVTVTGPDGEPHAVRLRGFIDRVEAGEEGSLIAVDLKTQRHPPTKAELPQHAQLGMYQYLIQRSGRTSGGAELIQLREGSNGPRVQEQPALSDEHPNWVEDDIAAAAATVRAERFWAIPNSACTHCAFRTSCPAKTDRLGSSC